MPNDFITLKALANELDTTLVGGRIDKVTMPSEEEVAFVVRANSTNYCLYASCRAGSTRIHLSTKKYTGLPVAPNFCMLLRKYLYGGVIKSISLLNEDRIFDLVAVAKNELNDESEYHLIIEIMGGASNVILTEGNYKIIDAVKRVISEKSRVIIPKFDYSLPYRNKALLDDYDSIAKLDLRISDKACVEPEKEVLSALNGLSKESAREIIALSKVMPLEDACSIMNNVVFYDKYSPSIFVDADGTPKGFYAYPYLSLKNKGEWKTRKNLSECIEEFYAESVAKEKKQRDTKILRLAVKRAKQKFEKKRDDTYKKIEECKEKERVREFGELLKCNLYRLEKGMKSIECEDYYNGSTPITIKLDETLSPNQNVEKYFKKYYKMKGAESFALKDIEDILRSIEYLTSIEVSIENCVTEEEYKEIEKELDAFLGKGKKTPINPKKKPKIEKKTPPLSTVYEDYKIYVGRNNQQNEEVTFSLANGGDLWLHAKNYHGAHGVIISKNAEVPARIIRYVAECVAYYSTGRESSKVEVDYTQRKFVKKLNRPGLVTYTNNKTMVVEPKQTF